VGDAEDLVALPVVVLLVAVPLAIVPVVEIPLVVVPVAEELVKLDVGAVLLSW